MFHLMLYRDLPGDFERRYQSAHIDPFWSDVADADRVGQYYNATLDEMLHAAKAGMHGLCTNQHHQNVYGFMANPTSWARFWRGRLTARTSRSSSSARRCLPPHRRHASPKNTRCSTASAAGGLSPDFPRDYRQTQQSPTQSFQLNSASATARRWRS